jgi:hypothetical protein
VKGRGLFTSVSSSVVIVSELSAPAGFSVICFIFLIDLALEQIDPGKLQISGVSMANNSWKTADLGRFKMANYFLKISSISKNQFVPLSIRISELLS